MHTRIIGQESPHQTVSCETSPEPNYLTLAQAAQRLPGRPSSCAVWRWCRKGVLARDGQRVKLRHIRLGGRIFTTPEAVADFGKRLAEADVAHFDAVVSTPLPPRDAAYGPPSGRGGRRARAPRVAVSNARNAEIERELEEEGL